MTMWAIIYDDHSGTELTRYDVLDDDPLDCEHFARVWADAAGVTIAEKTGFVPTGCADITVTIQEEPGSVVCWSSESFFIDGTTA